VRPVVGILGSSAAAVAEVLCHPACRVRPASEPVPLALAGTPAGEIFQHLVRMIDGEAHWPLKRAITSTLDTLDPHRVAEVSARCAERLARGIGPASDAGELMDFAYTMPTYVLASLIGIADEVFARVTEDVGHLVRCIFPGGTADQVESGIDAATRLDERFRAALTEASDDTLLGRLAAGMRRVGIVSPDVVVANVIGFLAQGYDGTAGLIGNTLVALARAPEMCARAADAPELLACIVANVLRREPTFQNTRRFVAEPTLIAGQQLQADDVILVLLAAANHDSDSAPVSGMGSDATASTRLRVRRGRARVSGQHARTDDRDRRGGAPPSKRRRSRAARSASTLPPFSERARAYLRVARRSDGRGGTTMIAVIFEVVPVDGRRQEYLDIAASLRPLLDGIDGFVSIERFESLTQPGKVLSLSFWRDEQAVEQWRRLGEHRAAQTRGRAEVFADYRLRVAHVLRDYGLFDRPQAPADSLAVHDAHPRTTTACPHREPPTEEP
jgi:heme-degrading monooxygenase HmoA